MLVAISLVLMMASAIMDTGKIGTLVLISFLPMILISSGGGILTAAATWSATLILSFLLLPDKTIALAYGLFFGIFAIEWYGLQRIRLPWLRLLAALVLFNISWIIGLMLMKNLWAAMPFGWIFAAGQPVFILYYYLYGYAVNYYRRCWEHRVIKWIGGRG